jgi:hypothetical protein
VEQTPPGSSFLTSSKHRLPESELLGSAFQGADLIIGDSGRDEYTKATGREVQPGNDGTYVTVIRRGNTAAIGTDFAGYQRLLVYRNGPDWALATSFAELVEFAARNGWPVTPDPANLRVFSMSGALGSQLVSHRTAVEEIMLLPATASVVVRSRAGRLELHVDPKPRNTTLRRWGVRYSDVMSEYLSTWLSRLATLARSDLQLISDITGGRDSRVVLGMLLRASGSAGAGGIYRIDFRSGESATEDLKVARTLDERFSLNLNARGMTSRHPLSGEQSFALWRQSNLGLYGPVYLSRFLPVDGISLGGAGGESHRVFYTGANMTRLLQIRKKALGGEAPFAVVRDQMLADLNSLRRGVERQLDERILHYRHFRDRLHGGRLPVSLVNVSPLAGGKLRQASALASSEHRERSQILADLLLNLDEDLALMDYDDESKKLDSRHLSEALDLSDAIKAPLQQGRVHGRVVMPPKVPSGDSVLAHFHAAAERGAHALRNNDWLPADDIRDAVATAKAAAESGQFEHAVKGKPGAQVILAATILDAATK